MIFWAPPYLLFPKFPASQLVAASRCLVEPTQASTCKKCIDQSACQSTAATILTSTWLRYTLFSRFGDVHNKKVSKSNLTSLRVSMPSVDDNHWKSMKQNIGETSAPKKPTASHRLWLHEPKLSVSVACAIQSGHFHSCDWFLSGILVFKTEEDMLHTSEKTVKWRPSHSQTSHVCTYAVFIFIHSPDCHIRVPSQHGLDNTESNSMEFGFQEPLQVRYNLHAEPLAVSLTWGQPLPGQLVETMRSKTWETHPPACQSTGAIQTSTFQKAHLLRHDGHWDLVLWALGD